MPSRSQATGKNQAALIPLYGGQEKRPISIDKDVVIVGRAKGCDLGLDAPDVSNLHCLIYRTGEGYFIRDCASRSGTRVNGSTVKMGRLADEDILQVGPFSFKIHLPHDPEAAERASNNFNIRQLMHMEQSRRNLAKIAIRYRRRMRANAGVGHAPNDELDQKASGLRAKIRTYDQRLSELEEAERELVSDRERLEKEKESFRKHLQKSEAELQQRYAEADSKIQQGWSEFQQRCSKEEGSGIRKGGNGKHQAQHDDAIRYLEEQKTKLQAERRKIDADRTELQEQKAELEEGYAELMRQQDEFKRHCDHEERKLQEFSTRAVQGQTEQIDEQKNAIASDKKKLADWEAQLQELFEDLRRQQQSFEDHCREEEARLQQLASKTRKNEDEQRSFQEKLRRLQAKEEELGNLEAELTSEKAELDKEGEYLRKEEKRIRNIEIQLNEGFESLIRDKEIWQSVKAKEQEEFQGLLEKVDSIHSGPSLEAEQQLEAEREKLREEKERVQQEHQILLADLENRQQAVNQAEASLKQQRIDLTKMMGDLKKMQEASRKQPAQAPAAVLEENAALRKKLIELDALVTAGAGNEQMQQENDELRSQLEAIKKREEELRAVAEHEIALLEKENQEVRQQLLELEKRPQATSGGSNAKLQAELELLKEQLAHKEELFNKARSGKPVQESDLEKYEAELHQYRAKLEDDRAKLNGEIEALRERNAELDEALRDMEMQMSRERAELGRERARLNQMREEIRMESEHLQREGNVRQSLAPLQKLRDELNRRPGANGADPKVNARR